MIEVWEPKEAAEAPSLLDRVRERRLSPVQLEQLAVSMHRLRQHRAGELLALEADAQRAVRAVQRRVLITRCGWEDVGEVLVS